MDAKKTVEFTQDRVVEDADGNVLHQFKAGKRYDLVAASADRWIRRGVAFDVNATPDEGSGESPAEGDVEKAAHGKQAGKAAHGNKKVP